MTKEMEEATTARKLNRKNEALAPELVLVQASGRRAVLAARREHAPRSLRRLQLLENRPKTTAGTYRSHVKAFLHYLATT